MTEPNEKSVEELAHVTVRKLNEQRDGIFDFGVDCFHAGHASRDAEVKDLREENERLRETSQKWFETGQELTATLAAHKEMIEELEMVIEHALHLGYLGEGSTRGMANDALEKLKAFREARG
jgi:hypothetical protein